MPRAIGIIASIILAAGCAPQYTQPDSAQPSAQLRLVSSLDGTFNAQTFVAYGDDACTRDGPDFGVLAGFNWAGDRGPDKIVLVRPDQRLFVKAAAQTLGKLTVNMPLMVQEHDICYVLVSFVPERSRRYEIRQPLSKTDCMAMVVDAETMQPPPTFQAHQIKDSCRIR
jgi:hypothetical protein